MIVAASMTVWIITGFSAIRYGLRTREALILLPLAMGTGAFVYFAVVFVLIRFLPAHISGWSTLALMLLASASLWYANRHKVEPLELGVSRRAAIMLILFWIASAGVIAGVRLKERHDEFDHLARAAMIAQAGQPPRFSSGSYINPEMCQQAHYAEGLIVGVLFSQSRSISLTHLFDICTIYNATTAIGLCFVFLWLLLKRQYIAWAVLGTFLFMTIGPPNWLAVLHRIPEIEQHIPQTAFFEASRFTAQFVVDPGEAINNPENPIMFPRTDLVSFMWYLTSPNQAGFWVVGFVVLIGWLLLREKPRPWYWWGILGAVSALSTVYSTTGLILLGPIIGFDLLWDLYKKRHMPFFALANLMAFAGATILLLLFQGGFVTDALFCPLRKSSYDPPHQANWVSLVPFLSYPGFTYHELDTRAYLYNPADWNLFFMAWGVGLFVAPLMLIHTVYRRLSALVVVVSSVSVSILIPFVIFIENVGPNMARIPTLAIWLLGAVSVVFLKDLWEKPWFYLNKLLVVGVILLMSLSTVGNVVQMLLRQEADSAVIRPIDYEVQQDWFGRLDVDEDTVFDPHVYREDVIGIEQAIGVARPIAVFGTYGRINGHTAMAVFRYGPETWEPWYESGGLPNYLTDAGYTYVYLTENDFNHSIWHISDALFNSQYYQLVQTWEKPESGEVRQLFEIVSNANSSLVEPLHPDALIKSIAPGLYSKQTSSDAVSVAYLSDNPESVMGIMRYLWNVEHKLIAEQASTTELLKVKTLVTFSPEAPLAKQNISWQLVSLPEDLLDNETNIIIVDQETFSLLNSGQQQWFAQSLFRISGWWIFDRQVTDYLVGDPDCFSVSPQTAEFGNRILLKSAGKALVEAGAERYICVRLEWQSSGQIERSYKIAAHVVNDTGQVIAQYDGVPAGYLAPTNTWTPGQLVIDHFAIRLPANTVDGQYEVRIIVYDEASGERLSLSGPNNGSDSFTIGGIEIESDVP